ncbi:Tim17 domain-containing protein [Rhizoctonia solani AG-1 IA]|uniref:Tim17 domain-containing protein n=1 Tax=Thanatephorus cucumeris (strain AG1-IA) TaxID=983506 RepID=L8X3D9_THACA|nr:Tim17 domain-containing protein [Rhizoctonia solani AG-1 IA]
MSFNSSSENNSGVAREDAAAYLRNASFSRGDGSAPSAAVTAADLLNATSFDPSRLHPMAGISDKLDYLALDDEKTNALPGAGTALPSRGWSDDLCYGTGTTYLSGEKYAWCAIIAFGGRRKYLSEVLTGYSRPLSVSSTRLRVNSILNSVTRRGSYFGNSAGVIGKSESCRVAELHDVWGSMAAGGISGAIYKSTAGVRPALAAAGIMTGLAGTWSTIPHSNVSAHGCLPLTSWRCSNPPGRTIRFASVLRVAEPSVEAELTNSTLKLLMVTRGHVSDESTDQGTYHSQRAIHTTGTSVVRHVLGFPLYFDLIVFISCSNRLDLRLDGHYSSAPLSQSPK